MVPADFVDNLTCHECLKVYNAANKTILECGKGSHFDVFRFAGAFMSIFYRDCVSMLIITSNDEHKLY